jgi:lipopolysaccharide export system protein LptA
VNSHKKPDAKKLLPKISVLATVMGFLLLAYPCPAQNSGMFSPEGGRFYITSDRLVMQSSEDTAEFTGNVHAVQADTEIRSDRLKIFYKSDNPSPSGQPGMDESSIERIEAEGSVTIRAENQTATSQKAVYTAKDGLLTLTGERVEIKGSGSVIVGKKVTLHRDTGEIVVSGSGGNRVEAVFESDSTPESGSPENPQHSDTRNP